MPIGSSPGELVGFIHCRTCRRSVQVDPATFSPAPVPESYRARLRCKAFGNRDADIRIAWTIPPASQNQYLVGGLDSHCPTEPNRVIS
jgi:hypothetical protein